MRHMLKENLALITPKQTKEDFGALATTSITGHKTVSAYDINYHFPLYLSIESEKKDLFSHLEEAERRPNINENLSRRLTEAYGFKPSPEEILRYIYAVLYAPAYREKYAGFLKRDFPRIPFTTDSTLFRTLAGLGERLVALHLLAAPELDQPLARFEGEGDNKLGKPRYGAESRRVYINAGRYFEGVAPEVWEYRIGGYQVCEKWLKDRKGRRLSLDDIKHYCRVVTALAGTIDVQREIGGLYSGVEKETI
jgi:hypothetical protein